MLNKKGFTSAEVLVTLGIVGVVAMMILPMTNKLKPNREMIMFKKAYQQASNISNELANDEELYPDDPSGENFSGLSNLLSVDYKGKQIPSSGASDKFCELFAIKIGNGSLSEGSSCMSYCNRRLVMTDDMGTMKEEITCNTSVKSPDGMIWTLPSGNFNAGNADSTQIISVDVNGDKGDNCFEGNGCGTPDKFKIYIDRWGKTWVEGDLEKEYINSTSSTKPYKFYKELIEKKKGS